MERKFHSKTGIWRMNLNYRELQNNPLDQVFQIIQNIERPLTSLIEESHKINSFELNRPGQDDSKEIIFSNTQEIKELVDQVLQHIRSSKEESPIIFDLYQTNDQIRSACRETINPNKISKQDIAWLIALEKEVLKNIDRWEIRLSDLSYNLSVSKRQLNRKIQNMLHLTPNKYIRILKLDRAKQLIDEFRYDTISQVAYAVGYHDTHYFSKLFFNQYHISPKELLNSKR